VEFIVFKETLSYGMQYFIRDIDPKADKEIDWVTRNAMQTVLETVPEFENDPQKAKAQFANFTFSDMRSMIVNSLKESNHRLLVVEGNERQELVGHSIFSLKIDEDGILYGSCFSRFIHPLHRRKGLASSLLQQAEDWWKLKGAKYIIAQTHVENYKLQKLFRSAGFTLSAPQQGRGYTFYTLRKELS
jgi:GNAT superfamily N-acetyltransferase